MNKVAQYVLVSILILIGISETFACICVSDSLDKRFKKAKAVFIGQVPKDDSQIPDDESLIQGDGVQTLEVVKFWKGINKKFIELNFEKLNSSAGNCPTLYFFEEDKQYLVFAYGNKLEVRTVCSDTWVIPTDKNAFGYEQMQNYIKKLDSFWFRFWARLNPF